MKVIVDRHRHAALLVKQTAKWIHILRTTARGLVADKLSEDELAGDWSEYTQCTVPSAIEAFLIVSVVNGATKGAQALLDQAVANHEEDLIHA